MLFPAGKLTESRLQGGRLFVVAIFRVGLLGGCSPTGMAGSRELLGSFTEVPVEAGLSHDAVSPDPQATGHIQSYAAADSHTPVTGGGLAGLFAAFSPKHVPEPPPPGEFIAPAQAPLPDSRPEYGDRPKVDLVALANLEAERISANPAQTRALAGSLNAYERREAGVPDDDDDDELEQVGAKTAAPQKLAFAYTPAHFEISRGLPLPLLGAMPSAGGNGLSSNGLALNAPAQRCRAAYDNVQTDCFPQQLRNALDNIAAHFNDEVLVTSGARAKGRRGSLHRSCKAADIRIVGVSPADLAAYARTVPGLNGVGTYRRVSVTYIDVRDERFAWRW